MATPLPGLRYLAWIVEAPKSSHGLVGIGVSDELLDLRDVDDVDGDHLNLQFGLYNVWLGGGREAKVNAIVGKQTVC